MTDIIYPTKSTRIGANCVVQSSICNGRGLISILSTDKDNPACLIIPVDGDIQKLMDALKHHWDGILQTNQTNGAMQ